MNFEMILPTLLIISTLTSLTTEAVKKLLDAYNITYHSNTLAGMIAFLLAIIYGAIYCIIMAIPHSLAYVIYVLTLAFLSWLCAMVGYDKVIQTIRQLNA